MEEWGVLACSLLALLTKCEPSVAFTQKGVEFIFVVRSYLKLIMSMFRL